MITIGTGFTGGGVGLARLSPAQKANIAWGIEYDPEIAEVYAANFGRMPIVARVQDVKPSSLDYVDFVQWSPVCKEFSTAKVGGKESPEEYGQALAIAAITRHIRPKLFLLENVRGYVKSESYKHIVKTLLELGYQTESRFINFANYGVPQTRIRLILLATRADLPRITLPPETHFDIAVHHGTHLKRWVGWYEAIEDLIPTLPESSFADWQLARLPNTLLENTMVNNQAWHDNLKCAGNNAPVFPLVSSPNSLGAWRGFLVDTQQSTRKATIREASAPTPTISVGHASRPSHLQAFLIGSQTTNNGANCVIRELGEPSLVVDTKPSQKIKALLVDGTGNNNFENVTARGEGEPCFTLTSSGYKKPTKAWLGNGRVVQMTPRALARFQNIPDSHQLSEKKALAGTLIGNGLPSGFIDKFIAKLEQL